MSDTHRKSESSSNGSGPRHRSRRRTTILVVDDSQDAHELYRSVLEAAGYEVLPALNGRDAVQLAVDLPAPHAVIVDLLMPVMDGMEFIDVLRSYRRLNEVPVLVVSGVKVPPSAQLANTRYLNKPFRPADLLRVLAEAVGTEGREAG